jgi:hypothetical protein
MYKDMRYGSEVADIYRVLSITNSITKKTEVQSRCIVESGEMTLVYIYAKEGFSGERTWLNA